MQGVRGGEHGGTHDTRTERAHPLLMFYTDHATPPHSAPHPPPPTFRSASKT